MLPGQAAGEGGEGRVKGRRGRRGCGWGISRGPCQAADISQRGRRSTTPKTTSPLAGSFLMSVLFSSPVFVPSVCPPLPTPSLASAHLCLSLSLPAWLTPRAGTSVSLLAVVVIVCGVALVAVFLFLFWKLCWTRWRGKEASSPTSANPPPEALQGPGSRGNMADKLKDSSTLGFLEAAVKISHTSPDIPAEVQMSVKEHIMRHARLQRQTTEPASSTR